MSSSNHRLEKPEENAKIYRIKIFNGLELHVLGSSVFESLDKFRAHPQFDDRIQVVALIAKLDL